MSRAISKWTAGGLLLVCSVACGRPQPQRAIVILVDTLRRDALGCYGDPTADTPRLDALAAEGVRFEQAISASGWTLPSVASLLTGTWPSVHKAMGKATRLTPISSDLPTVAEVFSQAGFATFAVANAAFLSPALGLNRGFDRFDHRHAFNAEIRRARESVDTALAMLSEHPDESLFLLLHLFDPHLDYDPRGEFLERHTGGRTEPPLPLSAEECGELLALGSGRPSAEDVAYVRGAYQGEVAYVDRELGRFLDELRKLGMYEDSWIVVTADHGEEFLDHQGFEHGHTLYDELVRVPLLVKPGLATDVGEPVVESQVRVLDVMPTLLEAFGLGTPPTFVGESLLGVIAGSDRADRVALCESTLYGHDRIALRDGRFKYVLDREEGVDAPEELYDWRTDPGETRSLVSSRPELVQDMRAALRAFQEAIASDVERARPGEVQDISPSNLEAYEASLRALGYVGRGDD